MLQEFKQLKTMEDKFLYLDTIGNTLLKNEVIHENICKEILELDYYLDEIDFWNVYSGNFLKLADRIEYLDSLHSLNSKTELLSEQEKFKFLSLCEGIFHYEQPIIVNIYDGNNREIASILISRENFEGVPWIRLNTQNKLLEMMESNGFVDVRYCTNDYIIKTMC